MSQRSMRPVAIGLGLAALLAANYYLRSTLEDAPQYLYSFLERFYPDQVPIIFGQLPTWRLFLPLKEITGAWVTSTLILTYQLERTLTPAGVWYLYNAIAILVAFGSSWALFRSAVFSFTFAICMGFGTQFYHAYAVTGGIASYIVAAYHMLLLFTAAQIVRGAAPAPLWWAGLAASVLLNMLGYEGWLDVLALVWVASPFAYVGLRHLARADAAARLVRVVGVLTAAGIVYVVMKVTLGFGQTQGAESDIVFNYDSLWMVADDLVSNVFTHAYLSLSNFLPPVLVGASSGYRLGAEHLIEAQHGYHEPYLYLVAMNQVFFWRYYAGAALVVLGYAIYRAAKRFKAEPSAWTLALIVFLLMILVPGATHTLIKFRPMNAMPVMTYHVTVGVIGASGLIAWLAATAWRRWTNRPAAALLVVAVWVVVFYGALARPPYLAYMAAQSGLGNSLYPNPMKALVERLGGTYAVPRGMAAYPLMPLRHDDDVAKARALLADLPTPMPAVESWQPNGERFASAPASGGGLDISGDSSQAGYQVMSPPFAVTPGATYLARVKMDVIDGRVCVGIISGDQQRWLVPPDGATAEYLFTAAGVDAVRAVIVNCNLSNTGNPDSRFHLRGGSYAMLAPAAAGSPP